MNKIFRRIMMKSKTPRFKNKLLKTTLTTLIGFTIFQVVMFRVPFWKKSSEDEFIDT
jgi:hypothetical protein